jgi:hypothetical protein
MHLCGIPEEAMNQLHIPNGVPLVYNVRAKCITLLEDKESDEQINIEDFGPAASYLFRPCELDDDFFEGAIERVEVSSKEQVRSDKDEPTVANSTHSVSIEEDIEVISTYSNSSSPSTNGHP